MENMKGTLLSVEYYSSLSNKKKRKMRNEDSDSFCYKYIEGVNNSVKYDVKMSFFMN